MEQNKIIDILQNIFRDIFDQEDLEISLDTSASDIEQWDSLKHISILEAVQEEWSVHFTLREIIDMKTAGDMVRAISAKI